MKIYFGVINLMIPLIMIIFGFIFSKNAPKEINKIYGYRTYMSMRNKDTWEYAHKVCGIIWKNVGFILLIITLIISIVPKIPLEKVWLGLIIVESVAMIGTIPVIEENKIIYYCNSVHKREVCFYILY